MSPKLLVIDLFCGAGGVTTGFAQTREAKVIACVNHDPVAIKSHWANHPEVLHFEEDIRNLDLAGLAECARHWQDRHPDAALVLWASLECTNFSRAKGGQPRDPDSRTLAEHLFRYIEALRPRMVLIENVEEFMAWGPLDQNGKPLSRRNGTDYLRWVNGVCDYGYAYDWRILNSADYGAYTSRSRYFGMFATEGVPIVFPAATHAKNPGFGANMFGSLQKWKPVREVLDFEDEGKSIFGREKPLSEKTLERIHAGLVKYVARGEESVIIKYKGHKGGNFGGSVASTSEPAPTVTTMNHLGVAHCHYLLKYNSTNGKTGKHVPPTVDGPSPVVAAQSRLGLVKACFLQASNGGNPKGKVYSVGRPGRVVTCSDNQALVQAAFISKYYSGDPESKNQSVEEPAGTVTTVDHHSLVQASFLQTYYGNGGTADVEAPCPTVTTKDRVGLCKACYLMDNKFNNQMREVDRPAPTLLTGDHQYLVSAHWLDKQYGSHADNHQSVDNPAGTITQVPKLNLCEAKFIMPTHFNNQPESIESPLTTITANRKWHYLVNPSWYGHTHSVDKPSPVLIARQDKSPMYVVVSQEGVLAIPVFEDDSPTMLKIKEFMAAYGLVDIKMRMLKVAELKLIQGFPKEYKLLGNQTDQKKFIGNSVVPHVVKAWAETIAKRFN